MTIEASAASRLRQKIGVVLNKSFVRFLMVGGVNTVFGYGVFAAIYFVTRDHRVAIVVATSIGIAFNFWTTGRVVFGNRSLGAAVPFVLGYGVVLGLNLALTEIWVSLGLTALAAQALVLPAVVLASYFINAKLVFRRQSGQ